MQRLRRAKVSNAIVPLPSSNFGLVAIQAIGFFAAAASFFAASRSVVR